MKALALVFAGGASLISFAALLGWIKTVYFLKPFGLSTAALDQSWASAALASWYVVQNVVYFAAILWLALQTRRVWLSLVALVYALIPLTTHYAFLGYERAWIRGWVDHQHTWLKLIPTLLLVGVVVNRVRGRTVDWRWRHGAAGLALAGLVVGSWGLSAAKHFGSYDAERILHRPEELLPRVELSWKDPPPDSWDAGKPVFLLHEDSRVVVAVEFRSGTGWARRTPRIHTISRSELRQVVVAPRVTVQPGGQYL